MKITSVFARTWSKIGQAPTFGLAMSELVKNNENIVLVTADMSRYFALDKAKQLGRLINVGIAEENLVGVSAGLAKEGFSVFAFTQAAFAVTRCLDFIKVNMGYMGLPVKLVGFSSGFSLGVYGATHIALDDIAQMRSISNMTIISPADCVETVKAVEAAMKYNLPVYFRLGGVGNMPCIYKEEYTFEIGKAITLRNGTDIAIIASGTMVANVLKVADLFEQNGVSCKIVNMHTIKPLDVVAVRSCLSMKLLVTVEEHGVIGGLGGAVAEVLAEVANSPLQLLIGTDDKYYHAGEYDWLLEQAGLTSNQIYAKIKEKYHMLTGKVALVTGASRGIGKAIAEEFTTNGAIVYANTRQDLTVLSPPPKNLIPVRFDVTDSKAVKDVVMRIKCEQGRLDILVNNAGIMKDALIGMIDDDTVKQTFEVNVFAIIGLINITARLMIRQKSGVIINIASIAGTNGSAGQVTYSASKGAIVALTKAAAKELAPSSIRVNAVAPGMIDTDLLGNASGAERIAEKVSDIKMARVGTPQEVASVCVFLASDMAKYVTGQIVGVDGGMIL